jgi:FtsZ-binding cell division protein ZapB
MHPIREDEEDVLARLEARLEQVSAVITRLKDRNAELESQLRDAVSARDEAQAEADQARQHAARLAEETDALRLRQKEAATRVKALLSQMEQMDLLTEQ